MRLTLAFISEQSLYGQSKPPEPCVHCACRDAGRSWRQRVPLGVGLRHRNLPVVSLRLVVIHRWPGAQPLCRVIACLGRRKSNTQPGWQRSVFRWHLLCLGWAGQKGRLLAACLQQPFLPVDGSVVAPVTASDRKLQSPSCHGTVCLCSGVQQEQRGPLRTYKLIVSEHRRSA